MDPVAQVFAQIGAATAHGEGMGQFFLQGKQLALQEQQLGVQRESLDLRSRMELQDSLLKTFAHEQVVKKLDEQVTNEAAISLLDQLTGKFISAGTASKQESVAAINELLSHNPRLRLDSRTEDILKDYKWAAERQQADAQFKETITSREKVATIRSTGDDAPGGVVAERVGIARGMIDEADAIESFDPERAAKLRFDAAQLQRPEPRPYAREANFQRIRTLMNDIEAGEAAGTDVTKLRAELAERSRPTTEVSSENLITGMPETRKVTGRYIAPLDQQNRVISLRKNTDSLGIIEDLERNNATEFVGLKPMVENVIWNQILPQLGINKSNERQTMAKTDFVRFVQAGIRSLNQEARLSNQDATMLIEAFPNLDSVLSSPPQARAILKTLKRAVALGAVRDAKEAQRGIPPIAGKTLYLEDWFRTYEQGSLTLDEAKELARHYKSPRQPAR